MVSRNQQTRFSKSSPLGRREESRRRRQQRHNCVVQKQGRGNTEVRRRRGCHSRASQQASPRVWAISYFRETMFPTLPNVPYTNLYESLILPNNYFNYCKVILQLQRCFNHYSTPMNSINGKFGIITVVCCCCYIHPSS